MSSKPKNQDPWAAPSGGHTMHLEDELAPEPQRSEPLRGASGGDRVIADRYDAVTIVEWHVRVQSRIGVDDPVCKFELHGGHGTVLSNVAGHISAIHYPQGARVPAGAAVALIERVDSAASPARGGQMMEATRTVALDPSELMGPPDHTVPMTALELGIPKEDRLGGDTLGMEDEDVQSQRKTGRLDAPKSGQRRPSEPALMRRPRRERLAALLVYGPSGPPSLQPVFEPVVTLGRARECDVVLYDTAASREHARIELVEGRIELVDLESNNGTLLNKQAITHAVLKPWDHVTVGEHTIVLILGEPPHPSERALGPIPKRKIEHLGTAPRKSGVLGRLSSIFRRK